jgi:hypothetical protein
LAKELALTAPDTTAKKNAATTLVELNEKTKESNCVVMAPFGSEKL